MYPLASRGIWALNSFTEGHDTEFEGKKYDYQHRGFWTLRCNTYGWIMKETQILEYERYRLKTTEPR